MVMNYKGLWEISFIVTKDYSIFWPYILCLMNCIGTFPGIMGNLGGIARMMGNLWGIAKDNEQFHWDY